MVPAVAARCVLVVGLATAVLTPLGAAALDRNDVMGKWLDSSEQDRTHILDELRAKSSKLRQADPSKVMDCMNSAAEIAGHRDLLIGDVAEACSEPPSPSDDPKTDI